MADGPEGLDKLVKRKMIGGVEVHAVEKDALVRFIQEKVNEVASAAKLSDSERQRLVELTRLEVTLSQANSKIGSLEERAARAEAELKKLEAAAQLKDAALDKLRPKAAEAEALKAEAARANAAAEKARAELQERLNAQTSRSDIAAKESARVAADLAAAREQASVAAADASSRIAKLTGELGAERTAHAAERASHQQTRDTVAAVSAERDAQAKAAADADARAAKAKADREAAVIEKDALSVSVAEKTARITLLERDLTQAKAALQPLAKLQKKIEEQEREIAELKATVKRLEADLRLLRLELEDWDLVPPPPAGAAGAVAAVADAFRALKQTGDAAAAVQDHLDGWKADAAAAAAEVADLMKQMTKNRLSVCDFGDLRKHVALLFRATAAAPAWQRLIAIVKEGPR